MPDLTTTANTFKELAKDASNLKEQLSKMSSDATLSDANKARFGELVTLAQRGVSELKQAADARRSGRINELDRQITALDTALSSGVDATARDHIRSVQNALRAEHAALDLVSAGDFSGVVRPDYVQTMLAHLAAAKREADTKARVAMAIPILVNATQLVLKVVGGVLAAVA